MEYKEGCVMWNLEAIVWTSAFTLRKVGKHWRILRRGVTESNILDNNSDYHVENRLRGDNDQDTSAHIQVGDDAGSDSGTNAVVGSGGLWIHFDSKAQRSPGR